MKVQLLLDMDPPQPAPPEAPRLQPPPPVSIEDQVRDALDCIDSGHNSNVEWILINRLYKELQEMKQTPRVQNLCKMIEPVLAKYGYHKTSGK